MSGIEFKPIGVVRSPYRDKAPYQPVDKDDGEFYLQLDERYADGLKDLDAFKYAYVIFHIDRLNREFRAKVSPPWARGKSVGLFASRSPVRPNPIGISIVRIIRIDKNCVYTSGLDVFDGTPILDIKPYIKDLDSKIDANYGWLEGGDDFKHLMLHIKGIPHDY